MTDQPELQGADWEQQLQQSLAGLPAHRAPARLRRRLRRIPGEQQRADRPWWLHPGWGVALALIPAVLGALLYQEHAQQRELAQELTTARRELALALHHLERANSVAGTAVLDSLETGVGQPVSENTIRVLQEHLQITQEL